MNSNFDAISSVKNELEAAKRELLDATARVETAVHSLATISVSVVVLEDKYYALENKVPKVGKYTSIHNYKCPICGEHDNLDELGHTEKVYSLGCPNCKIKFEVASYDPV